MGDEPCCKAATYTGQQKEKKRWETSMPQLGFEPTIPVFERGRHFLPQTARLLWSASMKEFKTLFRVRTNDCVATYALQNTEQTVWCSVAWNTGTSMYVCVRERGWETKIIPMPSSHSPRVADSNTQDLKVYVGHGGFTFYIHSHPSTAHNFVSCSTMEFVHITMLSRNNKTSCLWGRLRRHSESLIHVDVGRRSENILVYA
jgi:hypothetical protein